MNRRRIGIVMGMMAALALFLSVSVATSDEVSANPPAKPHIWVDGELYNAIVPLSPNGHIVIPQTPDSMVADVAELETTDNLYVVTSNATTPLVSDSAPGDSDYNGGRWLPRSVTWNEGYTPYELTSEEAVIAAYMAGMVSISDAGDVFMCPVTSMVN